MSAITVATVSRRMVSDPTVKRLVDEVSEMVKLEVVQAMSSHRASATFALPSKRGARVRSRESVGKVVMEQWLAKMPVAKQETARNLAVVAGDAPALQARARDLGVDLASDRYVLHQVDIGARLNTGGPAGSKEAFEEMMRRIGALALPRSIVDDILRGGNGVKPAGAVLNEGVSFRIDSVKADDETNPEWPGRDDIAMGGTAVAGDGAESTINEFFVGKFNDSDKVTFDPPKVLKLFDLENTFPQVLTVFVALAEKDAGGFSAFLTDLFNAIKNELDIIITAVSAAAGAAIGSNVGGTVGAAIGGPIGAIIGIVAGLILGAVIAWLAETFRDDVFEPQIAVLSLPSADATFEGGSLVSPAQGLSFVDFGGRYTVNYTWALSR